MATQVKQAQSIFPDLPRATPAVNKDGNFTQLWDLGLSALFQALQDNFKNEGILFPSLTSDQIDSIEAIYTPYIGFPLPQSSPSTPGPDTQLNGQKFIPDISGQTVFDSTNRIPKQFIISFDSSTPPLITSARWWTFTLT